MDVLGDYFGAIRLWNFEGKESVGGGMIEKEGEVWDIKVFWGVVVFIMDGGVRNVIDWGKELRDFSFFDMIDFFKSSDGRPGVVSFCSSVNGVGCVKDRGVGKGAFIGSARSRAFVVFVSGRHDKEVEVREEGGILNEVCKVSGRNARE